MKSLPALTIATMLSLAASMADAHAFLDHAAPAVGSTVHSAPTQVRIWFTEQLEAAFSSIHVFDPAGKQIESSDSRLDPGDASVLVVALPKLAPGKYKVAWRVLSVDTHVSEGDFTFDVAP